MDLELVCSLGEWILFTRGQHCEQQVRTERNSEERSFCEEELRREAADEEGLENPWTEEPGGLQSMGSLRVGHD